MSRVNFGRFGVLAGIDGIFVVFFVSARFWIRVVLRRRSLVTGL